MREYKTTPLRLNTLPLRGVCVTARLTIMAPAGSMLGSLSFTVNRMRCNLKGGKWHIRSLGGALVRSGFHRRVVAGAPSADCPLQQRRFTGGVAVRSGEL